MATTTFAILTIITAIIFIVAIKKISQAEKEITGLLKHWKTIFVFLILTCTINLIAIYKNANLVILSSLLCVIGIIIEIYIWTKLSSSLKHLDIK
ncbi:hypothetical protein FOD75_11110 (plasmid) [Limosilactobacillus reuteri]|uniref:Uncharacterized protein n=1 Tax=Limosilactobacillus reuteri TaxID=1598 RepID=A0A517D8R7_LIMRT|nr:hypothetical protein FOD75_11110 [Limosilactobacillus reuteri]